MKLCCNAALLFVVSINATSQNLLPDFDYNSSGAWNDESLANMTVSKVANGAVTLDGSIGASEYSFVSHEVIPTISGWPINWPGDREWNGPEDNSFTFYLAHDEDNLYVAVDVTDDVVSQNNDDSLQYWQDDSIELFVVGDMLTPPNIYGYDQPYSAEFYPYGGHMYFTNNGKMRGIDVSTGDDILNEIFTGSDWTYGPDGDISSVGTQSGTGWVLEVKIAKRLFDAKNVPYVFGDLEGQTYDIDLSTDPISFAIGIDDDDAKLEERSGFEMQYWAQMRDRLTMFNRDEAYFWNYSEIENGDHVSGFGFTTTGNQLNTGTFGTVLLSGEVTGVQAWSVYE